MLKHIYCTATKGIPGNSPPSKTFLVIRYNKLKSFGVPPKISAGFSSANEAG